MVLLQKRRKKSVLAGLVLVFLFAGMARAQIVVSPALPSAGRYLAEGAVAGNAERRETDGRVKLILRDVTLTDDNRQQSKVAKAYVTYYPQAEALLPLDGQQLSFNTRAYHPSPAQNPHGFDFRHYLLQRGISLGLTGAKDLVLVGTVREQPVSLWQRLRTGIAAHLDQLFERQTPLLRTLLIGDRDTLPEETAQSFRDTGIAHILAVSGLHVSILIAALNGLMALLGIKPRTRLIILGIFLLAYARLLDFSAPVVRAAILGMLLMGSRAAHERSDPLTSLSLAFLLILAFRPLDLFSVGFQLSFAAVLGIILLGDGMQTVLQSSAWYSRTGHMIQSTLGALITTFAATLFTAPLVALYFFQVAWIGLVLSPAAVALVGLVMVLALPALVAGALWPTLGWWIAIPSRMLADALTLLTEWPAALPWGNLRVSAPHLLWVAGAFAGWFLLSRYSRFRPMLKVGMVFFIVAAGIAVPLLSAQPDVRYTQFSAGSADIAVIEDGQDTYVIDAGSHGGDLASYLLHQGRTIDVLLITHLHNDHVGGLQQLLERGIVIRQIVLPSGAKEAAVADNSHDILQMAVNGGVFLRFVGAGDTIRGKRVSAKVVWPESGKVYPGMEANHSALNTLWDLDGVSLLTGGDQDGLYETHVARPAQILKVAHHGSRFSTGEDFLRLVRPQIALLSTSQTYAQRASAVRERLAEMDCRIISTEAEGAVILTVTEDGLLTQSYLTGGVP